MLQRCFLESFRYCEKIHDVEAMKRRKFLQHLPDALDRCPFQRSRAQNSNIPIRCGTSTPGSSRPEQDGRISDW